jgi:hypothetical protein
MPNFEPSTREMVGYLGYGLRCDSSPTSIANGQNALFNVSGRVWLVDLIGIVTTVIQTAATLLHFDFDADVGGDAAMCIDSADLTATAVGTMLALPAAAGSALAVPAGGYLRLFPAVGWVLSSGAIDLHASAARSGVIKWSAFYFPLEDGAYISAA